MNEPTKFSHLALILPVQTQSKAVSRGSQSLLLPEGMLQPGKSSSIVGRIGSEDVHTSNDCEDEREAEEEERMIVELSPVESAKAILIGAGPKLFRPKCRHGGFLRKQEEDIINTTAPCTEHSIRSKVLTHSITNTLPRFQP